MQWSRNTDPEEVGASPRKREDGMRGPGRARTSGEWGLSEREGIESTGEKGIEPLGTWTMGERNRPLIKIGSLQGASLRKTIRVGAVVG